MTVNIASLLKFGIFQKMLLAMLLVALVPLSIIWYIDYRSTITQTTATVDQQLTGVSDKLTAQVNDWVGMNLKALNQNAALAAGCDGHVAADQKCEPTEHLLLGQAGFAPDQLANPIRQRLVVGHESMVRALVAAEARRPDLLFGNLRPT